MEKCPRFISTEKVNYIADVIIRFKCNMRFNLNNAYFFEPIKLHTRSQSNLDKMKMLI